MLEAVRNRLALMVAPLQTKAVLLGSGVYDFHGPAGTANLIYSDGRGALAAQAVNRETAFAVTAMCYAAAQYRADNIAEAPPRVARLNSDDDSHEFVPHPLNDLLAEPSLDYTMGETMWLTQVSLDIYARSLWTKELGRLNQVAGLMPWTGREFSVEAADGRIYGKFRVDVARGQETLAPEDVVHFKYMSPYHRYDGISPTDAALRWLNLGRDVEDSVRRLMLNGMFPSAIISPDKDWRPSPTEFDLFKSTITAYQTGPANTGKPFIAMGGSKVTRIAFSLKDLLPDEMLDRIEATVAMCFGIAPVVLGSLVGLKNSPWSKFAEARRAGYDDTLIPLWERHATTLTRQLLRPVDARLDHVIRFDTSRVAALQEDRSQQITDAALATTWTLDERRAYAGQDAVGGEDGDWIQAKATPERREGERREGVTDPPEED